MASSSSAKKNERGPFPIRKLSIPIDGYLSESEDSGGYHLKSSEKDPFYLRLTEEAIHSLFATSVSEAIHISTDQKKDGPLDLSNWSTMRSKITAIECRHTKVYHQ
jgi:hypothetical protein